MQKSKAYEELLCQINATGADKLSGYSINILNSINNNERAEVEKVIWNTFIYKKDMDISVLLPKLQLYDGIQALKNTVSECKIPSYTSMLLCSLIYDNTKENEYLKLMEKNIVQSKFDYTYISILAECHPCEEVYELLVTIYEKPLDRIACGSVIDGILYNKGFIKDINDIEEVSSKKELRIILKNAQKDKKIDMIKKLENGEFDNYKNYN